MMIVMRDLILKGDIMFIGPLAHIKHVNSTYTVDWSHPGAVERFRAEEKAWWNNYWLYS